MWRSRLLLSALLGVAGVTVAGVGVAAVGAPGDRSIYRMRSSVVGMAGSPGASATKRANGTAGQSAPVGISSSQNRVLYAGFWKETLLMASDVDPISAGGPRNALFLNRPNPFRGSTSITYSLARPGTVELKVFDPAGRAVRTLVAGVVAAGVHHAVWDGRDDTGGGVASGIYFCRMVSGDFVSSRKVMFAR